MSDKPPETKETTEVKETEAEETEAKKTEESKETGRTPYKYRGVQEVDPYILDNIIDEALARQQGNNSNNNDDNNSDDDDDDGTEDETKKVHKTVKQLQEEVNQLKKKNQDAEAMNQFMVQMNSLMGRESFVKENPDTVDTIQEMVLTRVVNNPNKPVQAHFNDVINKMKKLSTSFIGQYSKKKIEDTEKTRGGRGTGSTEIVLPDNTNPVDFVASGGARRALTKILNGE